MNQLSRSVFSKIRPLLSGSVDSGIVCARGYHEKVIDHYENPRNVGSFDKSDTTVGTGLVGAPACGDVMKLQVGFVRRSDEENLFFNFIDFRSKSMKMVKLSMLNLRPLVADLLLLHRHWRQNGSKENR